MDEILTRNLVLVARAAVIACGLDLLLWLLTKQRSGVAVNFRQWWLSDGILGFLAALICSMIAEIL